MRLKTEHTDNMANLTNLKRLQVQDFPSQYQDFAKQLSLILNPMLDQLVNAFSNQIDFRNLNMQTNTISVTVDASGAPTQNSSISSSLKTKCIGMLVIKCTDSNNNNAATTSTPFISFTENNKSLTISKISGLTAGQQYSLTVISIGTNV